MSQEKIWRSVSLLATLACLSNATRARANFEECGGIFVSYDASCEYREREQCTTECKTEAVETACTAKLYTSCESECTETATTTCESSCGEVCTTDCKQQTTTEQPPSCMELCAADCKRTCAGRGRGRRGACCSHNCNARCEAKCKDSPPVVTQETECTETCTTACSGSCTAQANVECQLNCQEIEYTECETELVETCNTRCEEEGGAIFCDGQFLNAESAKSCAAELKAKLAFEIDVVREEVSETFDEAVEGTEKTAKRTKKKAKLLCSAGHAGASGGGFSGYVLIGSCIAALALNRTRKRRAWR